MSLTISSHPDVTTLMSFAAGTLAEPLAAVVAAHAAMCPVCRREVGHMEQVGAVLMCGLGVPAGSVRPANTIVEHVQPATAFVPAGPARADARLPAPITRAYGLTFETIAWKRLGPGVLHHRLPLSQGVRGDLRLLKIGAGRRMPEHGHGGAELTLVLDGAYSDQTGVYRSGDVQDVDGDVAHTPIADARLGCICLIASESPARFKGLVARLVQPLVGM